MALLKLNAKLNGLRGVAVIVHFLNFTNSIPQMIFQDHHMTTNPEFTKDVESLKLDMKEVANRINQFIQEFKHPQPITKPLNELPRTQI